MESAVTRRPGGEVAMMLAGHGLTTAKIYYRMPDYRNLIQTYVWQEYDLAPDFPKLFGFLDFWRREIEGPLHSVVYTHRRLIRPGEWRRVDGEFLLN
ncbi:MAG TPA: usg protein [Paracoccaceae bacterium]|nr:usg protein [Paracoccaceae bacterium]